ncbi:hypothetical protein [Candidatus Tisiphia endosymbiont of Ptychoptera albimana]|uniref:hypothetical protein n=1 Tax=Candidatus Tisiphia endosymbiont of Ptychoptera albimana TaxID=3066260 RepID=UPI00312C9100
MIKKEEGIIKLLNLVNDIFGNDAPVINDHWEGDLCAIGLQKDNKLIYVSITGCAKNQYFYECELLVDDPEEVYIAQDSEDNVTEERLLEVMSKFFDIPLVKNG